MKIYEVLSLGTIVETKIGKFIGVIREINIRQDGILYDVRYVNDGKIEDTYCFDFELTFSKEKNKIGFKEIC